MYFMFVLINLEGEQLFFFFISQHFIFKPKLKYVSRFGNYSLTVLRLSLSGKSPQLDKTLRAVYFLTDCVNGKNLLIYYFAAG